MKNIHTFLILFFLFFLIFSCKEKKPKNNNENKSIELIKTPVFNSDSAYSFIEKQVSFGPRVPNTTSHENTKNWLVEKLKKYAHEVEEQKMQLKAFNGKLLNATNIIARFNKMQQHRVLLCAHWDTRPFADQDQNRMNEPIEGANDGGSGVGVLLEIARLLSKDTINLGVDIVFFDAEDYGQPSFSSDTYMPDSYCLGSQYWAKEAKKTGYKASFGILLDMVGGPNALFTHEGHSIMYANKYLQKVWKYAHELGFKSYFSYLQTAPITDDHVYVNKIAAIPTIDIIEYDNTTQSGFAWYWHTHNDNMEAIDINTLNAVGQTVLQAIFQEQNNL